MNKREDLPTCKQHHSDCFANILGKCSCLRDTNLKRDCPFYKTKEQFKSGREKYGGLREYEK